MPGKDKQQSLGLASWGEPQRSDSDLDLSAMERRQALGLWGLPLWGDMTGGTLNTYNGTTIQNQNLKE